MGCNPNLEWLHCFQWEHYRQHHHRIVAALTLTLGVNGPLLYIDTAVKKRSPCSSSTRQSRLCFCSYLVLEVGDGEEEEFEELVEFGEGHVAPPLTQDPLVHVLQHPDAAHQQVPRRLAAQHRLPLQEIMGKRNPLWMSTFLWMLVSFQPEIYGTVDRKSLIWASICSLPSHLIK